MAVERYNAGIQRAKGLLEIAAALYDTSLSYKTRRAAEGVLQRDSRVGRVLRLSLGVNTKAPGNRVPISFTTGSFREIIAVAQGVYSLAWVNPSVLLTMAYRGKGPFKKRLPLRTIAVFPSFDVMGFAVHESTGITSLAQIKRERKALRVSTGLLPRNDIEGSPTMFTVSAVLRAAGFTLADMRQWGGKIRRRDQELGSNCFGQRLSLFVHRGKRVETNDRLGFRRTDMSRCSFHGTKSAVQTIDFSGWPMIVHAGMSNDVAYALCEAIASRKDLIPTDNYKPLNLRQLCANDDQAPFDVPLHPGAQRFYRERGYIK